MGNQCCISIIKFIIAVNHFTRTNCRLEILVLMEYKRHLLHINAYQSIISLGTVRLNNTAPLYVVLEHENTVLNILQMHREWRECRFMQRWSPVCVCVINIIARYFATQKNRKWFYYTYLCRHLLVVLLYYFLLAIITG